MGIGSDLTYVFYKHYLREIWGIKHVSWIISIINEILKTGLWMAKILDRWLDICSNKVYYEFFSIVTWIRIFPYICPFVVLILTWACTSQCITLSSHLIIVKIVLKSTLSLVQIELHLLEFLYKYSIDLITF